MDIKRKEINGHKNRQMDINILRKKERKKRKKERLD